MSQRNARCTPNALFAVWFILNFSLQEDLNIANHLSISKTEGETCGSGPNRELSDWTSHCSNSITGLNTGNKCVRVTDHRSCRAATREQGKQSQAPCSHRLSALGSRSTYSPEKRSRQGSAGLNGKEPRIRAWVCRAAGSGGGHQPLTQTCSDQPGSQLSPRTQRKHFKEMLKLNSLWHIIHDVLHSMKSY